MQCALYAALTQMAGLQQLVYLANVPYRPVGSSFLTVWSGAVYSAVYLTNCRIAISLTFATITSAFLQGRVLTRRVTVTCVRFISPLT